MSKLEVITRALSSNPRVGKVIPDEQRFCPDDNVEGVRNLVHLVNLLVVPKERYHTTSQFQDFMEGLVPSGYLGNAGGHPFTEENHEGKRLLNLGYVYVSEEVGEEETTIVGGREGQITRIIRLNPEEMPHLGKYVLGDSLENPCILTSPCTSGVFPKGTYITSQSYRRDIFIRPFPSPEFITERIYNGHKEPVSIRVLRETTVPLEELARYQPAMSH